MNAYQILQVSETASIEVIRAAWTALIRECHPDGPTPNEKKARTINEAYATLKDPKKRAALDAQLVKAPVKQERRGRPMATTAPPIIDPPIQAYPGAYAGFSDDQIHDAIRDMMRPAPPIVKFFTDMALSAARRQR